MKRKLNQAKLIASWNAKVAIGDFVDYRGYPEAPPERYTTRTEAQMLSGHTAVLWLNGKSGCVTVESCKHIPPMGR